MIENLKKRKELGPSAYPCNAGGFLGEMSQLILRAQIKYLECWNSKHFLEEAQALRMLVDDMEACVRAAIEADNQDQVNHQK